MLLILQVRRIERDETGGILCWKRMKQQSVHDRKYRGACADAQGQRQNGKKGKGRRSRYAAQSIIQVAEEVGEQIVPARCCRPWNALVVSALGPADLLFPVRHSSPSMTRLVFFYKSLQPPAKRARAAARVPCVTRLLFQRQQDQLI